MRYIPVTAGDRAAMLRAIGVESTADLFADIPAAVRLQRPLDLPAPLSEQELLAHLRDLSSRNVSAAEYTCFLGAGAYDHYVPSVVDYILRRGEFLTAYTPYQAEVSQGTLQAIYEYQTMTCELLGMEIANASLYDGASALAEAAIMAMHATGRQRLVVARSVHPHYRQVLRTYVDGLGATVAEAPLTGGVVDLAAAEAQVDDQTAALLVQSPNFFGCLEEVRALAELAHRRGALLVVAADPISLGLLAPPGECGADIAVAEGQSLGNYLSYGGPYLGLMATREAFIRRLPGRIVGQTVDARGRRAFVLTLQAREQHIRREKATSNICTNQALNALAATVYLSWVGKEGIRKLAELCLHKAAYARERITALPGWRAAFDAPHFKEFAVVAPVDPAQVNRHLLARRILGGYAPQREYPDLPHLQIYAVTEQRTRAEIDRLVAALEEVPA